MPRIPIYERGQVNQSPLPGVQMRQVDFGRGVQAPDTTALGNAIANSGNTLLRLQVKEREEADALRVEEQLNRLREVQIDLTAGQERGYQNQKGRNALDRPSKKSLTDEYSELFSKTSAEIEGQLANDNQKQLFRRRSAVIGNEFRFGLTRHESAQIEAYARSVDENTIKVETENAARNWNNPEAIQLSMDRAKAAMARSYNREGLPADKYVDVERGVISGLHKSVIESALGAENIEYAKQYFDANKDTMNQADKLRIQGLIDKDMNQRLADDAAANIWKAFGPSSDNEAVNLDAMQAELREQLKGNPDALKIAQAELKDRASTFDYSVRQRQSQIVGGVWEQVISGQSLTAIRKSDAFRELDGAKQAQIIGQIETFRSKGEDNLDKFADYWAVASNPQKLVGMSDAEIFAMSPKIGSTLVRQLLKDKVALGKTETKVLEVSVDNDLMKTLASAGGVDINSKDGKKLLGELEYRAKLLVEAEQQNRGRKLLLEEKQKIVKQLFVEVPVRYVGTGMLNSGKEYIENKRLYQVQDAEAIVVPEADRKAIIEVFKKAGIENPTPKQIRDGYIRLKAQ